MRRFAGFLSRSLAQSSLVIMKEEYPAGGELGEKVQVTLDLVTLDKVTMDKGHLVQIPP